MEKKEFNRKVEKLFRRHEKLISRKNQKRKKGTGVYDRYKYPVITAGHVPVFWKYDLEYNSNPLLLQRLGINSGFNAGAIELDGKICLAVRVEGYDRKSFFAIAESKTGIDQFRFRDYPVVLPEAEQRDTNVYDMRLTLHQDGWIYGVFCTERKDTEAPPGDFSSAIARCGIARTKDLETWERLDDLRTAAPQQRNCVLHPEFIDGEYAFYTRPQDEFTKVGSGGGIGWGLAEDIEHARINREIIINPRAYHSVKELKNGQGPPPLKTKEGWLHLAHGVRNTATGLRYVLYMFLTRLNSPEEIVREPGGYFMAPENDERTGDVSNVLFSNGWVCRDTGEVFIYYGSSDTRTHVATTSVDRLLDYVMNTPEDGVYSGACVEQRIELIRKNKKLMKSL